MMLYSVVLGILVVWRSILVQKIPVVWKFILSVPVMLISAKFYILRLFGGPLAFAPELPPYILLPVAWLFAVLILFCIWLICFDMAYGVCKLICLLKKRQIPGFFINPVWRITGLLPVAILITIGMYEGLKIPDVREYTIEIAGLPAELDGVRIIHLSDIHADALSGESKIRQIVEIANAQKGDLIVITGDFVDGRAAVRGDDLEPLAELSAPLGVYGVPGNHEYYSGYNEWMDFLNSHDVTMLENRHVMLQENFALGGVIDPAASHRGMGYPDVEAAFAGVPENCFKLLLAHQPKVAGSANAAGVDLQLSGHTHGGMVWGVDLLVGFFNKGLISGTYDVGDMKLHISNGTGIWNGFPIRLGHGSEIVVLTLKRY